jgi:methionine-rich copper-binding protein CopC
MRPRISALVFASVAAVALSTGVVLGHAEPDTVVPGSGAVVIEPPPEVVIEFSQGVVRGDDSGIDVIDEAGVEVTVLDAVRDNGNTRRMSVLMPADLAPGVYTVQWRTLSADDGDTDSGEYQFICDPKGTPDEGQTKLREDVLGPGETPDPGEPASPVVIGEGGGGTSWILVAAVAVGMLTIGSGVTFLLVQKRG